MSSKPDRFTWKKLQSGGPRQAPDPMGFKDRYPKQEKTKKTKLFVSEHEEHRKEIRKPR